MGGWVEVTTVGDLLIRAVQRDPDGECIVFPGRRESFAEVHASAERVARSLAALGVRKGDHVGVFMHNCRDYVDVMLAVMLLGAWLVPINARYKAAELAYVIDNADLAVLVTTGDIAEIVDFEALVRTALPGLESAADPLHLKLEAAPTLRSVVLLGDRAAEGLVSRAQFEMLASSVSAHEIELRRERVAVRDVAIMMYTSGTTAMPKGCPLSHEALVRTAMEAGRTRFELTATDRLWDPLPMFHMSFVLPFLACLDAGAALCAMEHFEPGAALRYIEDEAVTVNFASFPTITQALLSHPCYDPSRLKFRLINNVAPPDVLRAMQDAMPFSRQISAYGLTEAGGVAAFGVASDPLEARCETSGRPFRGIEIVAKDVLTGRLLEPGERGELCIRGYCLFEGYYKDPVKNAEAFDAEGFLHTGDFGTIDSAGRVRYLGRLKDMLKVGGENVAALEIESYLGTHPAVLIAQVVAAPDATYGEVPAAFVQLRPGADAVSETDLIAFCRGAIASFKVPRHVRLVHDWPMSATKIQKYRLREQITAELASSNEPTTVPGLA